MDQFNLFLHFLTDNIDQYIGSNDDGIVFTEAVAMFIDRADCEKGVEIFYQGANKDSFFSQLELIEEFHEIGNFGVLDFQSAINYILYEAGAENWEENQSYSEDECYYEIDWNYKGFYNIEQKVPDGLKEICERKTEFESESKFLFLNLYHAFKFNNEDIPIRRVCINHNSTDYSDFHFIHYFVDFGNLDKWFSKNRNTRNYNMGDNRHVENHPSYIPGKSPLMQGQKGKHIAKRLLVEAIGDHKVNTRIYNYDEINNCYIQFEYEGINPQNLYHGYHLVKPRTYEIDKSAVNKIPERVIRVLEYRKKLNDNLISPYP